MYNFCNTVVTKKNSENIQVIFIIIIISNRLPKHFPSIALVSQTESPAPDSHYWLSCCCCWSGQDNQTNSKLKIPQYRNTFCFCILSWNKGKYFNLSIRVNL